MIAHPAILDVSADLAGHLAWLLQLERRRRGTRAGTRALSCFWQAVLGLRSFRDRTHPEKLGRDHELSRATAYRYVDEVITVLADQAPDLHQALQQAHEDGQTYIILDGTVITTDRLSEKTTSVQGKTIDLWYSGKAHTHGGNIQALSTPNGFPLWGSEVEAGSVHDLTAAREHVLPALYAAAGHGLPTLADAGYDGTGIGVHTPIKQPTRQPRPRRRQPHLQRPTSQHAQPRRTRIPPTHPTMAHPAPHHRQPPQNRPHHPSRTRPHPPRTPNNIKPLRSPHYAIDLNAEHSEALHEELEPYTQHGKRLGGRKKKPQAPRKAAANANAARQPAPSVSNREQNQAIRTWAKAAGYEVSDRGRIPAEIVEAYNTPR